MKIEDMAFYALAAAAAVPGLFILLSRDIVRVAFWLLLSLSGVAGLYVLLGADFLGFTQVLVYIGGIMILILFGVMLTNRDPVLVRRTARRTGWAPALLLAALLGAGLLGVVAGTGWREEAGSRGPTVAAVGTELMSRYILPFEMISVLLLVVLVGAAMIARRRGDS